MFLDDELLQIGRSKEIVDTTDAMEVTAKMIMACFENAFEGGKTNLSEQGLKTNLFRVDRTFRKVIKQLEKENIIFCKEDGFRIWVNAKTTLKEYHF